VLDVLWHAEPGRVTVGTIEGLYRSDDAGETWFKLPGPLTHQTVYALFQGVDGVLWVGAADGLWQTDESGTTWQRRDEIANVTVVGLGAIRGADGSSWLWTGTEGGGVWLSRDEGASWQFGTGSGLTAYDLIESDSGSWMMATDDGLYRVTLLN
jgi:ligand-binding sensor domain-containing protein